MIVEELSPAAYPEWDAYVDSRPEASCYQLRGWAEFARKAGHETPFLLARDNSGGPVRGVLPLYVKRRAFHCHLSTGIFGSHGGIVADDPTVARALLGRAKQIADEAGASFLQVRALDDALLDTELSRRHAGWVLARLELQQDPKAMWDGLEGRIRRFVKTARKHQLEARSGPDQLPGLWTVYSEVLHRLGSLPQGEHYLGALIEALGKHAEVLVLYLRDKPVAASLVVNYHGVIHDIFGAAVRSAFEIRPNHLLYWEVIERGIAKGMRRFEIGTSFPGSGVHAYQASWGSHFERFPEYFYLRRGKMPGPPVARFLLGQVLRPLPLALSTWVGPPASRFFGDF